MPNVPDSLNSGPDGASSRIILAHGAGAGMTSPFMTAMAALLAERGMAVTRFEFSYMTSSRADGRRRPPPRVEKLVTEYVDMIALVRKRAPHSQSLIIGGKSLGGRVASLIAAGAAAPVAVDGLVCLGYPFHPPAQPERLRTAHLETLHLPSLIVQGERDPFGSWAEVEGYCLSPAVRLVWIGDGDHDFGPRGRSPYTRQGNLAAAADAVADYAATIVQRSG